MYKLTKIYLLVAGLFMFMAVSCTHELVTEPEGPEAPAMSLVPAIPAPPGDCDSNNTGPYCGCMEITLVPTEVWNWSNSWERCEICCFNPPAGMRYVPYYRPVAPGTQPDDCKPFNTGEYCGCQLTTGAWMPAVVMPDSDCAKLEDLKAGIRTWYPGEGPGLPEDCRPTHTGAYCGCLVKTETGRWTYEPGVKKADCEVELGPPKILRVPVYEKPKDGPGSDSLPVPVP